MPAFRPYGLDGIGGIKGIAKVFDVCLEVVTYHLCQPVCVICPVVPLSPCSLSLVGKRGR